MRCLKSSAESLNGIEMLNKYMRDVNVKLDKVNGKNGVSTPTKTVSKFIELRRCA